MAQLVGIKNRNSPFFKEKAHVVFPGAIKTG
jgi:hypothetical protein